MKYVQKDMGDAAEVNSGNIHQGAEFLRLLLWTSALILASYFLILYTTEYLVSGISPENEKKWLGKLQFQGATKNKNAEPSAELKRANEILMRLVQHPDVPDLPWRLVEHDSPKPNAFAMPGGTIGVTKGLLQQIKHESALAFVLGHELGHFKHRHHLKGFSRALSLGVMYTLIFGGDDALAIPQNALFALELQHSQKQEMASDTFSATIVAATFTDHGHMEDFFKLIQEKDALHLNLLASHPSSQARIDNLRETVARLRGGKLPHSIMPPQ
jgi:Zn-dependent protease with chaperone function